MATATLIGLGATLATPPKAEAGVAVLFHGYSNAYYGGARTDIIGRYNDCDAQGYQVRMNDTGRTLSSIGHRSFGRCNYVVVWKRSIVGSKGQLCYTGPIPVIDLSKTNCNDDVYSVDVSYNSKVAWAY